MFARKIVDSGLARDVEDYIGPETVLFNFYSQWVEENIYRGRYKNIFIFLVDYFSTNGAKDGKKQLLESLCRE